MKKGILFQCLDSLNKKGGIEVEKVYMVDEMDNVKEFDSLEDAREFAKKEEPVIINYATFYKGPADLFVTTKIATEGQLLGYGYRFLD